MLVVAFITAGAAGSGMRAECLLGPSGLRVGAQRALRTPCLASPRGPRQSHHGRARVGLGRPDRAEASRLVEAEASQGISPSV